MGMGFMDKGFSGFGALDHSNKQIQFVLIADLPGPPRSAELLFLSLGNL